MQPIISVPAAINRKTKAYMLECGIIFLQPSSGTASVHEAILPEGWSYQQDTKYLKRYYIVDPRGQYRFTISVFIPNRQLGISPNTCYRVVAYPIISGIATAGVYRCLERVYKTPIYYVPGDNLPKEENLAYQDAEKWLDDFRADWRNIRAYWDEVE
jgi:hypothetical protein